MILDEKTLADTKYTLTIKRGFCNINFDRDIQFSVTTGFDIYQYDTRIKQYKDRLQIMSKNALDVGDAELSQEIYTKYQELLARDKELHILSDQLEFYPKDASDYDRQINQYFALNRAAFFELEQDYMSAVKTFENKLPEEGVQHLAMAAEQMNAIGEVADIYQGAADAPDDSLVNSIEVPYDIGNAVEVPQAAGRMPATPLDQSLREENGLGADIAAAASSRIAAEGRAYNFQPTNTSVTFNVEFPSSGVWGNVISYIDFNRPYPDVTNVKPYNGQYSAKNGQYTINGLKPGGFYYVQISWSADGGRTYGGWGQSKCYGVRLPYGDGEPVLKEIEGDHISLAFESKDQTEQTNCNDGDIEAWIDRLDTAYEDLQELTGGIPSWYAGQQMHIASSRETNKWVDGEDYWSYIIAYSGNPITYYQPFLRSQLGRLRDGDWSRTAVHEISHNYDLPNWEFDPEVLADFKAYYVIEKNRAKIYGDDTGKWYTGSAFANYYKTDHMDSYKNTFGNNYYHAKGLVSILIDIKNRIGWEPFKQAFRALRGQEDIGTMSNIRKFNYFMQKLYEFSGQDVLSYISFRDKQIIGSGLGGEVAYYTPTIPPEIPSGALFLSDINLKPGEVALYKFVPVTSGDYTLYTTRYADSGATNDTVLEIYTDFELTWQLAQNDEYENERFASVTRYLYAGDVYYIKIRNFNDRSTLHTQFNICKKYKEETMYAGQSYAESLNKGESVLYRFTPLKSGNYVFRVQAAMGSPILELFESRSLLNRLEYGNTTITKRLERGITYYLKFSGRYGVAVMGTVSVLEETIGGPPLLEFTQKGGGVYLYTNNPESILEEDLVDGPNKTLFMKEENLTGRVVAHVTHSKRNALPFGATFDVAVHNPGTTPIKVRLNKFGCQVPDAGHRETRDWCAITAWSNYLGLNSLPILLNGEGQNPSSLGYSSNRLVKNDVITMLHDGRGYIEIPAGGTYWLMQEYKNKTGKTPNRIEQGGWAPSDTILELEILGNAVASIGIGAYKESPDAAGVDFSGLSRGEYEYVPRKTPEIKEYVEGDIAHKAKGKANTLPVVETQLGFDISNQSFGNIDVRIKNFKTPENGLQTNSWISNLNPLDGSHWTKMSESGVLGFRYTDKNEKEWFFDTRHKRGLADGSYTDPSNPLRPRFPDNQQNIEITSPSEVPSTELFSLGNFGVTERYYVTFRNLSNQPKTIKYYISTYSGMLIRANLNNISSFDNINEIEAGMQTYYLPEVYTHSDTNETQYYKIGGVIPEPVEEVDFERAMDKENYIVDFYENGLNKHEKNRFIFSLEIPANTPEYNIAFETILTTNGTGGQEHSFVVE